MPGKYETIEKAPYIKLIYGAECYNSYSKLGELIFFVVAVAVAVVVLAPL